MAEMVEHHGIRQGWRTNTPVRRTRDHGPPHQGATPRVQKPITAANPVDEDDKAAAPGCTKMGASVFSWSDRVISSRRWLGYKFSGARVAGLVCSADSLCPTG